MKNLNSIYMMKLYSKTRMTLFALSSLTFTGAILAPITADAQISGGILGISDKSGEAAPAFRVRTTPLTEGIVSVSLVADFQRGAPEAHAFLFALDMGAIDGVVPVDTGPGDALVGSDAADSLIEEFDGGDGPDYVVPVGPGPGDFLVGSDAADSLIQEFDGGDGPDYVVPIGPRPTDALVGSDAADSLIQKFDGGDGPDYVTPIGPGPGDALVGSDAADSFIQKFDGGDGPDYQTPIGLVPGNSLVGSDAADSLIQEFDGGDGPDYILPVGRGPGSKLRMEFQITSPLAQMHEVHRLATELHQLISFACDSMSISFPVHGLSTSGNEVAIFEDHGVSLKADGNEVAVVQSLDVRSIEDRWFEWSYLNGSANVALLTPLAAELDFLLWGRELGLLTEKELEAELINSVQIALLISGF
ncbi:MAG: hypothetical protein P1U58_16685 [Verrucomicrobiales bacterium]|nr:hypothetical protein [Verrucomicrobiales bacterium]